MSKSPKRWRRIWRKWIRVCHRTWRNSLSGIPTLRTICAASSPGSKKSTTCKHRADGGGQQRDSNPLTPLTTLGDYRIVRELGRGGMGVVYEAEQLSLGRTVALKVLPFAGMLDERQLIRFKNEARAAATLDHPNIVPIQTVGCERGVHFFAMGLIEGYSLARVIEQLQRMEKRGDVGEVHDLQEVLTDGLATLATDFSSGELLRSQGEVAGSTAPTVGPSSSLSQRRSSTRAASHRRASRPTAPGVAVSSIAAWPGWVSRRQKGWNMPIHAACCTGISSQPI